MVARGSLQVARPAARGPVIPGASSVSTRTFARRRIAGTVFRIWRALLPAALWLNSSFASARLLPVAMQRASCPFGPSTRNAIFGAAFPEFSYAGYLLFFYLASFTTICCILSHDALTGLFCGAARDGAGGPIRPLPFAGRGAALRVAISLMRVIALGVWDVTLRAGFAAALRFGSYIARASLHSRIARLAAVSPLCPIPLAVNWAAFVVARGIIHF